MRALRWASRSCPSASASKWTPSSRLHEVWTVLNGNRAQGLWNKTAPPAPEAPVYAADTSVDVVVVGAGYTGLSAALYLAQRGVRVVVLEAETIGYGAAGRSTGLVNAGLWLLPDE